MSVGFDRSHLQGKELTMLHSCSLSTDTGSFHFSRAFSLRLNECPAFTGAYAYTCPIEGLFAYARIQTLA